MIRLQIPTADTGVLADSIPSVKDELTMLKSLPFDELVDRLVSSLVTFAINLMIALLVLYLGRFIIRKVYKFTTDLMYRRGVDRSLSTFVLSAIKMVLYFILFVTVIGIIGIETSSFLALFASAGIAIGMALSGTLQNFAGGVMILLLKPYRIGDYIEAQGYMGTVREIQIFHTVIATPDNKSIIIPNGGLSTGTINNWSKENYRRVDWTVGISYGDDIKAARNGILKIINEDPLVVKDFNRDNAEAEANRTMSYSLNACGDAVCDKENKIGRGLFGRPFKKRIAKHAEELKNEAESILRSMTASIDPTPEVVVDQLADSAVMLKARAWTRTENYWTVYYRIMERVYDRLPHEGVNFPFPQMDVHINTTDDNKTNRHV